MEFAVGEIAFGHSGVPSEGTELIFFSYPSSFTFNEVKSRLALHIDLSEWKLSDRMSVGKNFLERLVRKEPREFVRYTRP